MSPSIKLKRKLNEKSKTSRNPILSILSKSIPVLSPLVIASVITFSLSGPTSAKIVEAIALIHPIIMSVKYVLLYVKSFFIEVLKSLAFAFSPLIPCGP